MMRPTVEEVMLACGRMTSRLYCLPEGATIFPFLTFSEPRKAEPPQKSKSYPAGTAGERVSGSGGLEGESSPMK